MVQFSYCFCLTLIHSLWQAALLFALYLGFNSIIKKNSPATRINLLLSLLLVQLLLSISTFCIYYTDAVSYYTDLLQTNFSGIAAGKPFFEKLAPWLISAYGFILISRSGYLITNWIRFKAGIKTALVKPSIDLKLFTTVKSFEFGIHRKVNLWYSSKISTPMTFGFFKPVILLPVALLNNLSMEETESLIIHELTHIRNNDYLLNWMLVGCETIFFFNPFLQALGNKIRLEREKKCDTQVLQFNFHPINYAETLLKAASLKATPVSFSITAATRNKELLNRIKFFTNEDNLRFNKRNFSGIALIPVIMIVALNTFLLNLMPQKKIVIPYAESTLAPYVMGQESVADFNNNKISVNISAQKLTKLAAEVAEMAKQEKNKALVLNKMDESLKKQIPEAIETEPAGIAIPVSINESDNTKEVTLKEESFGRTLTRVYKMKFVNSEWKAELLWTITEKRVGNDSNKVVTDTAHYFNIVQ